MEYPNDASYREWQRWWLSLTPEQRDWELEMMDRHVAEMAKTPGRDSDSWQS